MNYHKLAFFSLIVFHSTLLDATTYVVAKKNVGNVDLYTRRINVFTSNRVNPGEKKVQFAQLLQKSEKTKLKKISGTLDLINLRHNKKLVEFLLENEWDNEQINQLIRLNAHPLSSRFFKNGVQQTYSFPISYLLPENIFAPLVGQKVERSDPNNSVTGLIIEVPAGTTFRPALLFRIVNENNVTLYAPEKISFFAFRRGGMAYFARKPLRFSNESVVGKNPSIVTASPATTVDRIVLYNHDIDSILAQNKTLSFLSVGNVIVIMP